MVNRREFLRAGTAASSILLAGCNLLQGPVGTTTPTEGTPTAGGDRVVSMIGSNAAGQIHFNPIGLRVDPGTTVSFRAESGQHSTTAFHPEHDQPRRIPEAAEPWYSGALSYSSFDRTFEVEGTYDYFCSIHYNHAMVGRLVVGEPGGPAEGTDTPYGPVPAAETIVEEGAISHAEFADDG